MTQHDYVGISDPRVWIGCLSCYNDSRLVGNWYPIKGADQVTLQDVHRDLPGGPRIGCEELNCFDIEGMPFRRECDPIEAAAWSPLHEQIGNPYDWFAFREWVALTQPDAQPENINLKEFEAARATRADRHPTVREQAAAYGFNLGGDAARAQGIFRFLHVDGDHRPADVFDVIGPAGYRPRHGGDRLYYSRAEAELAEFHHLKATFAQTD